MENLNSQHVTSPETSAADQLERLFALCVAEQASDLHLTSGLPPYLRVQGVVNVIDHEPALSSHDLGQMARCLVDQIGLQFDERKTSIDGAVSSRENARFRFNIFRCGGSYSIAIRRLEDEIRQLSELGLSNDLYRLADLRDGLVLLAGPTGCGKSTTLATLIDRINRNRRCHIVTIEDPVEYLHPSRQALVHQRQIGSDAESFNEALVSAMRQDPDVILVGEIRDLNTIRTAITAAETGHLVLTTVHASDCVGSIDRLVSVFPVDEQPGIRRQLSMVTRAIIAQHLVVADGPSSHAGNGRQRRVDLPPEAPRRARLVLASEVLHVNSAVANLIAHGKDAQIYSMMETGSNEGMYTMEEKVAALHRQGDITERTALALCRNPNVLLNRLRQSAPPVARRTT